MELLVESRDYSADRETERRGRKSFSILNPSSSANRISSLFSSLILLVLTHSLWIQSQINVFILPVFAWARDISVQRDWGHGTSRHISQMTAAATAATAPMLSRPREKLKASVRQVRNCFAAAAPKTRGEN